MKREEILYQIKLIDKIVVRHFIQTTKDIDFTHIPTPTQMQILGYLVKHIDEEICQRDLENVLHLRRATVSGVLKTMEKNHLIERTLLLEDARTKKIVLNETARKLFLESKRKLMSLSQIALKDISDEELDMFYQVLQKMQKNLEDSVK